MSKTFEFQGKWRLYVIVLCLFIIKVLAGSVLLAQQININKRIQISNKVLTIDQLLNELHSKYSINFSYNDKILPLEQSLKFQETSLSLNEILKKLGEEARIGFKIYNDLIILTQMKPQARYTISGYVEDSSSGEKLPGANVYNQNNLIGTTSNAYGFYSITLAAGSVKLVVSYVGYKRHEQDIDLNSDTTLLIKLIPSIRNRRSKS